MPNRKQSEASCAAYDCDQKQILAMMMRTIGPLTEGVDADLATSPLQRALRQYTPCWAANRAPALETSDAHPEQAANRSRCLLYTSDAADE